ncbi:MAG: hypothetical protein AB2598_00065 [Candidatus Thiodiazotropha sp.]
MKQITGVIAISTVLALAACENSNNAEMSITTDTKDRVAEPDISANTEVRSPSSDQAAFEAGTPVNENSEETVSRAGNIDTETTGTTNND